MATIGLMLAVLGMAIEGIGVVAMTHYPVRRRLPSPFLFFGPGFLLFVLGVLLHGTG